MEKTEKFIKDYGRDLWFGALGMNLLSAAYAVFVNNNPLILIGTFGSIVLLVLLVSFIRRQMTPSLPTIFEGRALGPPRKGVVLTVGLHSHKKGSPALKVLEHQRPKYCVLIGTAETFQDNVGHQIALQAGLNPEWFKEETVKPTNLQEIKVVTAGSIRWMMSQGLHSRDIVVDITGGTVLMSLAAYATASELGVDTQYVYSQYDRDKNKPMEGTQKALLNPKQMK